LLQVATTVEAQEACSTAARVSVSDSTYVQIVNFVCLEEH